MAPRQHALLGVVVVMSAMRVMMLIRAPWVPLVGPGTMMRMIVMTTGGMGMVMVRMRGVIVCVASRGRWRF
jgi:hypothetical protein